MPSVVHHAPSQLPAPSAADASDDALVAAVIKKDRKATAEFVARFADPVHAYVRQRLAPRMDLTDDVVQEVFLAALKGLPSFAGRSSLRSWMLGIARHKVEDHYRATLRRGEVTDVVDEVTTPVELPRFDELMDHAKRRAKTRRVLSRLPEAYGYALLWRYWERRSVREIATEIGRTEKACERLLARARNQFKRLWEAD